MGEIAINPIHNVHKKYRTMNLVNPYIFAPPVDLSTNTEIGGVASAISTPALLAAKFLNYPSGTAFSASNITNFEIIGSDIKCFISGEYTFIPSAFDFTDGYFPNIVTYYYDYDNLAKTTYYYTFQGQSNLTKIKLEGIITLNSRDFVNTNAVEYYFPNLITINNNAFRLCVLGRSFYIPNCTKLGGSVISNGVFDNISSQAKIYCHPSLATNNGGAPDGDLAYAITQGAVVRYVTNFTAPNPITDLSTGTIYNTAIQLNFTPPSSTNTIEYYECYANGVFKNIITTSGQYITGLTPNTNYSITLKAVDVFYNKGTSNTVTQATNTTWGLPTTGLVSYYKLDEISGTVANDSYGTQHLTNTGVSINQTGKVGKGYKSTASVQKLQTSSATPITGNFSLNMWIYVPAAQALYATPFEVGNYGTNTGFGFLFNSNNTIAWRINQVYNNYNQSIAYSQWNMITMVYNGTNVKFYVNGILTSTVAHTANPNTTQLRTAFYRQDQEQQAICSIDEISIHNTAITQTDIDLIYNSGIGTTL